MIKKFIFTFVLIYSCINFNVFATLNNNSNKILPNSFKLKPLLKMKNIKNKKYNKTINYSEEKYTISTKVGSGSGFVYPFGLTEHSIDETVTIIAEPDEGYVFDKWEGTDNQSSPSITITNDSKSKDLIAHFKKANILKSLDLEKTGEWGLGGFKEIMMFKDYILTLSTGSLEVFKLNGNNLQLINKLEFSSECYDFDIKDNYLFMIGIKALYTVDLNNPEDPKICSIWEKTYPTFYNRIIINGNYAYVSNYYNGVYAFDISNPKNVKVINYIYSQYEVKIYNLKIYNSSLFILGKSFYDQSISFIEEFDISTQETEVKSKNKIELMDSVLNMDFSISGNYIYDSGRDYYSNQRYLYQISLKNGLELKNKIPIEKAGHVFCNNEDLYLTTTNNTSLYNIKNPDSIYLVNNNVFKGRDYIISDIEFNNNQVYGLDYLNGLKVIEKLNNNFNQISEYNTEGKTGVSDQLEIEGGKGFLAHGLGGIKVLDLKDPNSVNLLSQFQTGSWITYLNVSKNKIFAFDSNDVLYFFEINNDNQLVLNENIYYSDILRVKYVVNDNALYVLVEDYYLNTGIYAYEITDDKKLKQTDYYSIYNLTIYDIIKNGNYLYYAYENGTGVLDITNKTTFNFVTSNSLALSKNCKIANNFLYSVNGLLTICDLNDPENPKIISKINLDKLHHTFTIFDNYLVAGTYEDFKIIDISDKSHPKIVKQYFTGKQIQHINSKNGKILISEEDSGTVSTYTINELLEKKAFIPHIDWSSQWKSYLIVDNADNTNSEITVNLFKNGELISTLHETVYAGKSKKIELKEGECGNVLFTGDKVFIKESFVNNVDNGIAEFTLNENSSKTLFYTLPQYNSENLTWMGLVLYNPFENDAYIKMRATDLNGNTLDSISLNIGAMQKSVGYVNTFFKELDFRKVAKISVFSNSPLCGINISGNGNEQLLFTTANNEYQNRGIAHISHIANEWNQWENFIIFDSLEHNTYANLTLYNNGTIIHQEKINIPWNSSKVISLNDYKDLSPETGEITYSSRNLAIRQSYINKDEGGTAEFLINGDASNKLIYNFPSYTKENLTWMGMSVYNTEEYGENVNLKAYYNGELVGEHDLFVEGKSRKAFVLTSIFNIEDGKIDRVIATSNGLISGLNISGSTNKRLLFTLPNFR